MRQHQPSEVFLQLLVLLSAAAPTLLGICFGSYITARLVKRLLRSRNVLVWTLSLCLSLVWTYFAYVYAAWLLHFMRIAGTSAPAVGADIFGLFRGVFFYGPLIGLLLGPSVVALLMTLRSPPHDFSLTPFVWQRFLLAQFRGPHRFYWWAAAMILIAALVRIASVFALSF